GGPAMTQRDATPSPGTGADRTHHDRAVPRPPGADRTEQDLRDALQALAGGVLPDPDAYRTARGTWLRRERRRRLVLTVLVAVVLALAVPSGPWVHPHSSADPGVILPGNGSPSAGGPSLPRLLP